ncbi:MAG: RnfABCDGE type electron transport complex subunit D [Thermoplasmata archaeon]
MAEPEAVTRSSSRGPRQVLQRALPPVRLLWMFLAVLAVYGIETFGYAAGLASLLVLPVVAVVLDLLFQAARFPRPRFPDAAIATGLFLALIFPPTAPLLLAATAAGGAIALRHILRYRGRPWFNPAMTGALLGSFLFGLAPAWWVAVGPPVGYYGTVGEFAMLAMGGVLLLRNWRAWRLPAAFFLTYAILAVFQHVIVGASTDPRILFLEAIDPVTIFFGLYMVAEPRTAPAALRAQTLYAGVVGVAAALFPIFTPTIAVLLALFVGNLMSVALRRAPESSASVSASGAAAARRGGARRADRLRAKAGRATPVRWSVAYRIGAGFAAFVAIAAVAGIGGLGHSSAPLFQLTGPGGGGGGGAANCEKDNPSIPVSTLSTLHKMLGPSVILSYNSGTGVVVFYDPVNQVTVTETDLYEDYGYAEFNGDDYAVSGCAA